MFTGYQYFVHFHSKTSHIEKVQNKDRLIQLNLPARTEDYDGTW